MMARHPANVAAQLRMVRDLKELIRAIDLRVPQVDREGETGIALAAALLRAEAVTRIAEIERTVAGRQSEDSRPPRLS